MYKSTAFKKESISNSPSSLDSPSFFRNLIRFNEARLQAELLTNMYSEQGFDAQISSEFLQVFHLLIIV